MALVLAACLQVGAAAGDASPEKPFVVDLNHATAEELGRLPGVGPKRAEAILARRKQAPFTRVTQLLEVKGIGKKTLERLRPHLRVVPVVPLAARSPPEAAATTGSGT